VYDTVKNECLKYDIEIGEIEENRESNITVPKRAKRASHVPQFLNTSVVLSTLGKRGHSEATTSVVNDSESNRNNVTSMENRMKRILFETIDKMCAELDRRFTCNEDLLLACDTIKPDSSLFMYADKMINVANSYPFLCIEPEKLNAELSVAQSMLINMEIQSVEKVIDTIFSMKVAFPNLCKICQFILTVPVSSASAERSFSTMKRVKTYLRSTMSDNRLSNLCLLSIERSLSEKLMENPSDAIDYFASMKDCRLRLQIK
jgi:hypothetical protein